jgi:glycosyltransferase involved in cell wall biosynthesis
MPEFKVATMSQNGVGNADFGFMQYRTRMNDMEPVDLPEIWWNHAGTLNGIFFSIQDLSRMLWFGQPKYCMDDELRKFVEVEGRFRRFGYFPIDGTGIADMLTSEVHDTIRGYDRVLAYTDWAAGVVERTVGKRPPNLPHGIDLDVFKPYDRRKARQFLEPKLGAGDFVVGIVATNQSRKDWGLGLTVVAKLRERMKQPVRVWIHTDCEIRHWSIPALVADLGLQGNVVLTMHKMTDAEMAKCYSACDVTLGIGLGEGWGFPLVESLACGVPVVHGDYAGGAEIVPPQLRVKPVSYRLETICNRVCPVFNPEDWVNKVLEIRDDKTLYNYRHTVGDYHWPTLWPKWKQWFLEGLR